MTVSTGEKILKETMTSNQSRVVAVATNMKKTALLNGVDSASYGVINANDVSAIETAINNLEGSASGNCCQSNCCQTCQTTKCQSTKCQSCQSCQSTRCQSCQTCQKCQSCQKP